jgi:endonuclease/exonuclease/phosphatase family metal-dependent hydrolase
MTTNADEARTEVRSARTRRMVGGALATLVVLVLASCGTSGSDPEADTAHQVKVLSRNLYLGADLAPLFDATPSNLATVSRATYDQVVASDVEDRMAAVAGEIIDARPDVVALQEATLWRLQGPGAVDPVVLYDFVALLLADLGERDLPYELASSVDGFSGGLPVEGVGLVSMQDRDVILVRDGSDVTVGATARGTFDAKLMVTIAGAGIEVVRGWTSVDASVAGRAFRVVATHLEAFDDAVRDEQQSELLEMVDDTDVPTVLAGDFNSASEGSGSTTYRNVLASGFDDVWTVANGDREGPTCCRSADLRTGTLAERIDYVLFAGPFDVTSAEVVGADESSQTPAGLWSSDHAGVASVLTVPAS